MIETRDCVIIDTEEFGLVAVLPVGMSQICSCNWEDTVQVGAKVGKGDPMGYFLFGGSDIVMVFQGGVDVEFLCQKDESGDGYKHVLMGEPYANLKVS
jgi:phosphatidylserine decarboxylase